MDSLTRCCMAQREVGLSAGEPPATRGYPPSVFALLPQILERAGSGETGSITGIYTVLVDGDDHNEPISDASRSILDGHVTLTRALAHQNHYPAIDVLQSISRVMSQVTTREQRQMAGRLRELLAAWQESRDLIEIGAYKPGSNALVDEALAKRPAIERFLRQSVEEVTSYEDTWRVLEAVLA
jgi:flagellum-specific ATP synthase